MWKKEIETIRHMVDSDPALFAFCVRDWEIVIAAGLRDLAWALSKDDYATRNDALGLLKAIEDYISDNNL